MSLRTEQDLAARALSFGKVAHLYDRGRPGYPIDAARWLTSSEPITVVEVAAGTGKFTASLLELRHDVIATDPSEAMLEVLRERLPDCRVANAPSDAIGVPNRSADAVVIAQGFHWLNAHRTLTEAARVLKPEGTLGLVWNTRDNRTPWVRKLSELIGNTSTPQDPIEVLLNSRLFGFVEEAQFRFWQHLRRDDLHALVLSKANIIARTDTERERLLRQVDALYDEYAAGPTGLSLPYITKCYKAVVRPVVLDSTGPIEVNPADVSARPEAEAKAASDQPAAANRPPSDGTTTLFRLS